MSQNFEERYRNGDTPWDHGMVDFNLIEQVSQVGIQPCRALDIGCGTGENAIWLAEQGFEVLGCDLSETAIERAKAKALKAGVDPAFQVADFLEDDVPGAPYGFVFDRGCLHCVDGFEEKQRFAAKVAGLLEDGACWLSLMGNADEIGREEGPPQLTAREVTAVLEPFFEILLLKSGHFGSDQENPPRSWICFMRKRLE